MPIIYTYPSATPTANDLLVFSDVSNTDPKNATRKCAISDLIALMPGIVPGGGTVTSVGLVSALGGITIGDTGANPIIGAGTFTLNGTLETVNGGTGLSAYTAGDIVYYNAGNLFTKLTFASAPIGNGDVLTLAGGVPTWATPVVTSTPVTSFQTSLTGLTPSIATTGVVTLAGTLGVASGGTGATTLTDHGILLGSGTAAITPTAAPTDGQLLIGKSLNDPQLGGLVSGGGTVTITYADPNINLEVAAGGTMTSFNVDGDSGPAQTITDSNTLNILAVNGLSTTALATDTIRINPPYKTDPYAGLGLRGSGAGAFTPSTNLAAWWALGILYM